jgi:hypothetical protein
MRFERHDGVFTHTDIHTVAGLIGCVNGFRHQAMKADTRGDICGTIKTKLNTGIAVITPAQAIADLLEHPEMIAYRAAMLAREQQGVNNVSHE